MTRELPHDLVREVQKHTGFPWWNGETYARFVGYPQRIWVMESGLGMAIDDLADVMEALREERNFVLSDRVRTIAGRLARLQPPYVGDGPPEFTRDIARGWK